MRKSFPDLPGWTFEIEEVSAGVYRGKGIDEAGRSAEASGTDPESVLDYCRHFPAQIIEREPRQRKVSIVRANCGNAGHRLSFLKETTSFFL